jgi:hypothetical protein
MPFTIGSFAVVAFHLNSPRLGAAVPFFLQSRAHLLSQVEIRGQPGLDPCCHVPLVNSRFSQLEAIHL